MLRIDESSDGQTTWLRFSGRLQSEHLPEVRMQLHRRIQKVAVNLEELRLVDRDVARFLGACESNGIELLNCPLYIREWIRRENRESRP